MPHVVVVWCGGGVVWYLWDSNATPGYTTLLWSAIDDGNSLILFLNPKCHLLKPQSPVCVCGGWGGGMQGIVYLGFTNPVQCPPMFGTGKNVCVVRWWKLHLCHFFYKWPLLFRKSQHFLIWVKHYTLSWTITFITTLPCLGVLA